MQWFSSVSTAAAQVPISSCPLKPLIQLCRTVVTGYPILYASGFVSKILSDDLNGNVSRLEKAVAELEAKHISEPLVADLLEHNPSPGDSGVYGLRWVGRTLLFVSLLLERLGNDLKLSISQAGRDVYGIVLQKHHAPVFGFVVKTVLYWAPTRAWVLSHTLPGATNEAASAACKALSAELSPLALSLVNHAHPCLAFNDVISSLPFGL
jgi:Glycolipid transfer protein (GLTP)